MTPFQRAAAELLAEGPRTSNELWQRAAIAFLRELLAEPVQKRAAVERLAFEQWYDAQPEGRINPWDVWQAADLLRELAAEPVQEPVAWHPITRQLEYWTRCSDGTTFRNHVVMPAHAIEWSIPAPQQQAEPVQKPVAWMFARRYGSGLSFVKPPPPDDDEFPPPVPLYLHPPQRAHGITGEPT